MSAPTPLRVRLPFRSEDEFVAQYGAHVGRDGFFLATRAPKAVGAQLLFDLILADGTSLLRGEGVVVRSKATGERPGMTLRFVRLEEAGRALVERILSSRPARGAAPAEARAHPSAWAAPVGPSAAPVTPSRDAGARPAHREAWAPPVGPAKLETPLRPSERPEVSDTSEAAPVPIEAGEVAPSDVSEVSPEVLSSEVSDGSGHERASETAEASEVSDTSRDGRDVEPGAAAASSEATSADARSGPSAAPSEASEVFDTAARAREFDAGPAGASAEPASADAGPGASLAPDAHPETRTPPIESAPAARASRDVLEVSDRSTTSEVAAAEGAPSEVADHEPAVPDEVSGPSLRGTHLLPHDVSVSEVRATPVETSEARRPVEESSREVSDSSAEETPAPAAAPEWPTSATQTPAGALGAVGEPVPSGPAPAPELSPPPAKELPPTLSGQHPPLDDSALPELVVTEFKGPGPRRPVGLEHTPASADVHAAITPPAGTLIVTELDEPPPEPEPKFQLDAPVRGDEPLHLPESSFHDVAQALGQRGSVHERPTTPIPLLPSMETAAPDEIPIPPPAPPLDEAPHLEEGAVRIEAGADLPRGESPTPPPAGSPVDERPTAPSFVPPTEPGETGAPPGPAEARAGAVAPSPSAEPAPAPAAERIAAVGTAELGIEINPESVRAAWFHDGRAEALLLDGGRRRAEVPVRLVREPGAPPRMLAPDAPDVAVWVGAPLPFLGSRADSDASRTVARRWPAAVVPDDRGEVAFALEGGTVGATELVATLLRWVRHRAEELTSHQPGRVVLTVPVAFNTLQRERLREASERAGFEGVRLVQAPTAATMAFAHGRGLARRRILVWRMGASTCDIAVLAASGDDLDMVTCGGDASLGSVNFDEQIALALDKGARADAAVLRRRIAEAEELRTQLEEPSLAEATVEGGARLTRAELEARTTALVERGVLLAREVLRSASLTPEALDELVLVGAATRLPHVRRMIEEAMGRSARTDVDVTAAVSMGAATLAHLLVSAGPKSASRTALHEVLGVPLEIIAPELGQIRVLDRNTRLPAEKTLTLTLGLGTPLEVQVFQGTARAPDPRSFLGLLRAPADRAGDWTLNLSLDTDGVLRASATNPSGRRQQLQLLMPAPSPEAETPPPQRVPSEPETSVAPPREKDTGLFGGLKRLFGRR